jgi:sulfur carrier protein ThiS
MPTKTLKIQLALLSKGVNTYKVKAGTKIKDFLAAHDITPRGDIIVNNRKAKPDTVLKEDSMIMLVPKVAGA